MSRKQLLLAAVVAAFLLVPTIRGVASDPGARLPGGSSPGLPLATGYAYASDIPRVREHLPATDGIGLADALTYDGFGYYAPVVFASARGLDSRLTIQNLDQNQSAVELWFRPRTDCARSLIADNLSLMPAETRRFEVTRMMEPGFEGSVWIRTSRPAAVAIEHLSGDVQMSYNALPSFPGGSPVVSGALLYPRYATWNALLTVQNLSSLANARVRVSFLNSTGRPVTYLVDWICPRGTSLFFVPALDDLGNVQIYSIRIESQDWWAISDPDLTAPDLAAVVHLVRYDGPAREVVVDAIAYSLLPEE